MNIQLYFNSPEEVKREESKKRQITNPKYYNFTQRIYTVGDPEDFYNYSITDNSTIKQPDPPQDESELLKGSILWYKYSNITMESITNTFKYLFYKFKKAIFISIRDNKLVSFLPFSNYKFVNEWGDKMRFDPRRFKNMNDFLIYCSKISGHNQTDIIQPNTKLWGANNCLIRFENPLKEGDKGVDIIKDMLLNLCSSRKLPDIDLFINKRDFPLINKDETEPYSAIYGDKHKLLSHNYSNYCPILSFSLTEKSADIFMPTTEDWARVSCQEDNKYFIGSAMKNYKWDFSMPWELKKSVAVFRGSSTGCGVDIDTNMRLKVAKMRGPLLDSGITKWNTRPKKLSYNEYLECIEPEKLGLSLVKPLTPEEQSTYKYVVNIDGNVSSYRLSLEMSMGVVILKVASSYSLWFSKGLKEWIHYVPVAADLSDLYEKIEWCRANDSECKNIAQRCLEFYNKYLKKDGVLDFLQQQFFKIRKHTGNYYNNQVNISSVIHLYKENYIDKEQTLDIAKDDSNILPLINFPFIRDNIANQALQKIIRKNKSIDYNASKNINGSENIIFYDIFQNNRNYSILCKRGEYKYLVNEMYCGLVATNKLLIQGIPNFVFLYYQKITKEERNSILLSEYISGESFDFFLKNRMNTSEYLKFIIIIILALEIAWEKYGFIHGSLSNIQNNIILVKLNSNRKFYYRIKTKIYEIETDIIPIIKGYENSSVLDSNGINFIVGNNNSLPNKERNEFLLTTLSNINRNNYSDLIKYIIDYINNSGQINYNFVDYLLTKYRHLLPINIVSQSPVVDILDPMLYVDFISKEDSIKIKNLNKFFDKLKKCKKMINDSQNLVLLTWSCNCFINCLKSLSNFIKDYYGNKLLQSFIPIINNEIVEILDLFKSLQNLPNDFILEYYNPNEKYNPRTPITLYTNPYKLLTYLQGCSLDISSKTKKEKELYEIRDMFIDILCFRNEIDWMGNYDPLYKLINLDIIVSRINNSNINTVIFLSNQIYPKEIDYLEKLDNENDQLLISTEKNILKLIAR